MKQRHPKYKHYKRKSALKTSGKFRVKFTVDLPEMEDYFSKTEISAMLREATAKAMQNQLEKGIPVVRMEEGNIYKFYPDGRKELLANVSKGLHKLSKRRFYIQK